MSKWAKFDNIDAKALNEEMNNLGDGDYPEIPVGKYEVRLDSLELKPTKEKGNPMVAAQFTIVEGEFKNQKIFVNQVILTGDNWDSIRLKTSNAFLSSLRDDDVKVSFKSVSDYESQVDAIADAYVDTEYLLEKGKNKKGYDTFKILEIYEK